MTHSKHDRSEHSPLHALEDHDEFVGRHIGPRDNEIETMLRESIAHAGEDKQARSLRVGGEVLCEIW